MQLEKIGVNHLNYSSNMLEKKKKKSTGIFSFIMTSITQTKTFKVSTFS